MLALALFDPSASWGQPSPPTPPEGPAVVVGAQAGEPVEETTLLGRFGVPVAKRLLFSNDPVDRLRGIERAGALATEEAIDALVNAMEVGSALSRDPEARLTAVRALAPHAHRPGVRAVLTRELSDPGKGKSASVTSLADLLRESAALALARSVARRPRGDDEALQALLVAVRQGGLPADAATRALVVYPPPSLEGILDGFKKPKARDEDEDDSSKDDKGSKKDDKGSKKKGDAKDEPKSADKPREPKEKPPETDRSSKKALAPAILVLLGELGDMRAVSRLRAELKRRDQAGQIAAAIALAKLGDVSPADLARSWIKRPDARLQTSATEVLVRLGTPDAPRAVATLLSSEATRVEGVRFALAAPTPALVKALEAALPKLRPEEQQACVEAIGRAGDAAATAVLVPLLDKPDLATAAAFALANGMGDDARDALAIAFAKAGDEGDGSKRRLLVRAGIVRALATGEAPSGLTAVLAQLAGSKRSADRHVAAFGLVALGDWDPEDVIAKGDDASMRGAAGASLARGADAVAAWVPVLVEKSSVAEDGDLDLTPRATAAGVALLSDEASALIPTSWLLRRAEEGGALSPLASRALAMRDEEALRPQIERLLEGTDPVVRAHVARGLGASHQPDAVSLLVRAYRFEPDAAVRRAIVRGLSARAEVQREQALRTARDLDPDDEVRALARSALAGRRLDGVAPAAGPYVGWIDLVANDPSVAGMAVLRGARFVRSDGVAVPQVSSDDGVLLVAGLGLGRGSVRLAPATRSRDASAR